MAVGSVPNFKLKLKKPDKILTFDDSDLSEYRSSNQTNGSSPRSEPTGTSQASKAVLPRSVPNHLLFISILEHLCSMYSRDSKQAQDIFKSICEQLANLNVVSPLLIMDEMSSLRAQYRHSVHRMLIAAVHKSNKGMLGRLPLPAPNGLSAAPVPALTTSVPIEAGCESDSFVNQTSRYSTEFVEMEKIGRGGFGSVYKARNKLDGKLYAIKVVKFKHSKPENIFRVLREVKALANLQHTNIVGYNACWLEYGACNVLRKNPARTRSVPNYELHSEPPSDDHVIFLNSDSGHTVDFICPANEGMPINNGPKIKEIGSNCSSLASSPQSNPASPPKHVALYQRNKSDDNILNFSSRQANQLSREVQFDFTASESQNTSTWSALSYGAAGDSGQFSRKHCKFVLDSEESSDDSVDVDGGSLGSAQPNRCRVYKRSISCDPVASGEVILPNTNGQQDQDFAESNFPLKKSVTLYIQMELCGHTLKEWMQNRNEELKSEEDMMAYTRQNMSIFKQILKAVDYIHLQGVMHRDLKPRNVFLTDDGECVKVGDFGLAKEDIITSPVDSKSFQDFEDNQTRLVRTASVLSDHTSGIGTSTYAAPEQLYRTAYNTKCDVYSLGMILFELFQRYGTEMERLRSLTDLRKGVIPCVMHTNWPVQTKYIEMMTSENPEIRPSVKSMLGGELFLSKDQVIEDLRAKEIQNQKEIEMLRKLVAERDKTIEKLLVELGDTSVLSGTSV